MDVVCDRSHRINDQDLDVKKYHESFGQFVCTFLYPPRFEISNLNPNKLHFLVNSISNQEAVKKQLNAVFANPIWPKLSETNSLIIECTLTPEPKEYHRFARTWETNVRESFERYFDLLHVCKCTISLEAIPYIKNKLKSVTMSYKDDVVVVVEKSNRGIYVTGLQQAVTDVSKQVSDIIVKVDQELDKKKQQVQKEKMQVQKEIQLKRHLVIILQFCNFEQDMKRNYKDISLSYDISKHVVKFEGPSGDVTSAMVEMYDFVSKIAESEKHFSLCLQQFLQTQSVYLYVNSKMKERNIVGVWEFIKEETLTVYSLSDQQADQAAHLIKQSVIETPIKLSKESTALLPTKEWQSKVEEIEQTGQGLIKIMADTDQERIIILCTDKLEGLARGLIEDFMLANTIYEEKINLGPSMMRFLETFLSGDLNNVGKSLEAENINIVVTANGFVIKSTQTGLNQTKCSIDKIIKVVQKQTYSIDRVGIRKYMESSAGKIMVRKVERLAQVVIQVGDEIVSDEEKNSCSLTTGANRRELAVCFTKEEKKISAMVVDVLELDVDLIVNSVTKEMNHIGGFASFLVKKGKKENHRILSIIFSRPFSNCKIEKNKMICE